MPKLTSKELAVLAAKRPGGGYPSPDLRYKLTPKEWADMERAKQFVIPDDGPWHVTDHVNRRKHGRVMDPIATEQKPMSSEKVRQWRRMGLLVDTAGRPLHPRASQILTHPNIGMFTGPGQHYFYGPQRMGNLKLRRVRHGKVEYAVVGVRRSGKLRRSVPGGYCNIGENTQAAAFREGWEEMGIKKDALGRLKLVETISWPNGVKNDTLHAWGEEWFTLVMSVNNPGLEGVELRPDGGEAVEVYWMTPEEIEADPDFIKTHKKMILAYEGSIR